MWCGNFFWCIVGHLVVYSWITSSAHGSALKVSDPVYLHVGSSDSDSEMGYIKNMKDDGKKGFSHFESFHNKDGDDYGYEKHEAFGYSDNKDSNNGDAKAELNEEEKVDEGGDTENTKAELNEAPKDEEKKMNENEDEAKVDLQEKPIVVADEENQVENYHDTEEVEDEKHNPDSEDHQPGGEDHLKNEDYVESEPHDASQDHEDIKVEVDSGVQQAEEENTDEPEDENYDKDNSLKIIRSDDDVEETPEERAEGVEDHQDVKEEQDNEEAEEEHTEPEDYREDYENEDYDDDDDDYRDEKKKTTRNAEEPKEIYTNHRYEVTENAEIVEGDQTQQVRFPYGFYSPLTNLPYVQTPLPATQATPLSHLNTRVNYGFYSPFTGMKAPQPTRSLAPTFSPRLSSLVKPRKNLGAFGYETMIYHHPGNNPQRQAIQIKIYDGEISVPATNVKANEEEKAKNTVDYDDDDEEDEESGEVEEKQNLRQESSSEEDSGEDSASSEESGEKKPSSSYQYKPKSPEDQGSDSAEEDDSDDLQSRLVTTSDVDNDAYYWL